MICERKRGGREATSGFRGINKWKKDEQQVERGIATGGNVKSTSGSSQIARQIGLARQPDGLVQPGSQEVGKLEYWKVVRKLESWKVV